MQRPHFRPRFIRLCRCERDAVLQEVGARAAARSDLFIHRVRHQGVRVWMADAVWRPWSPSLDLNVRDHPEGTLIVGRFGPSAALMTGYLFSTIGLSFLLALSLTWSYVQTMMDEPPKCLVGSAAAALGLVAVWGSGRVGAALGRDQMHLLADLLEGVGELRDDEAKLLSELEAHRRAVERAAAASGGAPAGT
jgi:hypothetical protein